MDKKFFTKYNKSRLFNDGDVWVITKKLTPFESKLNAKLITGFRKQFNNRKHQDNLAFFVRYILTHSLVNDATLSFDNIEDLQKFLGATDCLGINEYIYLSVHHLTAHPKPIQKQWQNSWKKLAKNHIHYQDTAQRIRQPMVKLVVMENKSSDKRQILSYFASFVYILMAEMIE